MTERVVLGPCLTRAQAARRAGIRRDEVPDRPDLLWLPGWVEETYFAFQFDERGPIPDVGRVVLRMHGRFTGLEIADWLVRPNASLDGYTPLRWLETGHGVDPVLAAVSDGGPVVHDMASGDAVSAITTRTRPARSGCTSRYARPGYSFG